MATTDHVSSMVEEMDPGCVVLRYCVVAEVLDQDGDRTFWSDTHEGATRQDIYGLLTEALEAEKAQHYREIWNDSEDD